MTLVRAFPVRVAPLSGQAAGLPNAGPASR
jgi:hypothetical protein